MSTEVQRYIDRNTELKRKKMPWFPQWQLVGEYIMTRKQDFSREHEPGEFLSRELFDSTAPRANHIAASSLLGMLWPQGSKNFRLRPARGISDSTENKEYFEFISETVHETMSEPKAGLNMALQEYMEDDVSFGTSGLATFEDPENDVSFKAWNVKQMSIDEGPDGLVNTIYYEFKWPVRRVVSEYGLENVSQRTREAYSNNKLDQDVTVLYLLEPRLDRDVRKQNSENMAVRSLHIEIEAKHVIKERGFEELPVKVSRFWKIISETYGRSPGMEALPAVLEINAVWEALTIAIEKALDPPLGVLDDGKLGAGVIDTSAGALNVFNITGRAGEVNPVFELFKPGKIEQAVELIEKLTEEISNHYFLDRLLDFNNETQMTLGEAQIRNRLRNSTLGGLFNRQITEVFSPTIERVVNILLRRKRLGVIRGSVDEAMFLLDGAKPFIIPDEIAKRMMNGEKVYEIEYFTPAARIMQSEEAEGILRTWDYVKSIGEVKQDAFDVLDTDDSIRRFAEIAGAPSRQIRSKQAVEEIRAAREEDLAKQQEAEMLKAGADAARNFGQSGLIPGLNNNNTRKKAA